jgi:hypothetical protein
LPSPAQLVSFWFAAKAETLIKKADKNTNANLFIKYSWIQSKGLIDGINA